MFVGFLSLLGSLSLLDSVSLSVSKSVSATQSSDPIAIGCLLTLPVREVCYGTETLLSVMK